MYGIFGTVKLLLDHPNINVNKQNKRGLNSMTICDDVEKDSRIEILKLILRHSNFDMNKLDNNNFKKILVMLEPYEKELQKSVIEIFTEIILNQGVYIEKDIFELLIKLDVLCSEPLLSRIFCPLKFDYSSMFTMLKNHSDKNKFLYYCNLHTNVKKEICKNILDHKEKLYCIPNNIIALCSKIDFELRYRNKTLVFEELDDKLKFIFDIKNEEDMIKKVSIALA